jgi:nitroreductase
VKSSVPPAPAFGEPVEIARPSPDTLALLARRRSASAPQLTTPAPNAEELHELIRLAARAPDHGKLFPWRFLVFEGKGRQRAGDILAEVAEADGERAKQVEEERERFARAPLVIGVISAAREQHKIPVWEQELSAGAVCQNLLIAATASGFVANWITEWYAYHPVVKERLGLKAGERVAGFIYIGTAKEELEERPRPDMDKIVSFF